MAMTRTIGAALRSARRTSAWNASDTAPAASDGDDDRRPDATTPGRREVDEGDVGGEGADRALGEVDQARAAVDQHRALREQGVGRAGAEPDDQELQERLHRLELGAVRAGVACPRPIGHRSAGLRRRAEGRAAEDLVEADLGALDEVALEPVGRLGLGIPARRSPSGWCRPA